MADYWDNAAFGTTSPAETADKPLSMWDKMFGGAINSLATLPKRAIDASAQDVQHLGEPDYQRQSIGPAVETAMKMIGGASPFAENAAVGAAGGRLSQYKAALDSGQITRPEYEGFMQAMGQHEMQQPLGFADKAAARVELNSTGRRIDRYYAKDYARREGGPGLTPEERADWIKALKTKQAAQQYLDSSQAVDLP